MLAMIYTFKNPLLLLQWFFIFLLHDIGQGTSRCDRNKSSERGYYDEMTHVISSLNEPEMKMVQNNITASICGIRPS